MGSVRCTECSFRKGGRMKPEIVGFIIREGDGDYTLWTGEFNATEKKLLETIAGNHQNDGASVRGSEDVSIADLKKAMM